MGTGFSSVRVEIYTGEGNLLEEGEAQVNLNGLDRTYTATQANSQLVDTVVKAIATDVSNNEGSLELTL